MKRLQTYIMAAGLFAGIGAITAQAQDGKELIAVQSGGLLRNMLVEHMFVPFTAETGIKVIPVDMPPPDQWAKIDAAIRSGGKLEYDLISSTEPDFIERADMLYEIDCAALPNFVKNGLPGSCRPHGVVRTVGTQMIIYDKEVFSEGPKNWADFWDVKRFPGARAMPDFDDRDWWNPVIALLADGVEPDKLWPLDLERAYKKLDQIKPNVTVWWKNPSQILQMMRSKEVVMLVGYSGRALNGHREGLPWGMVWESNIPALGFMSILKGSPHTKEALAFLDYFYANDAGNAKFMQEVFYGTGNKGALESMPLEEQMLYPSYPANYERIIKPDYKWIGENRKMLRDRWNTWISQQ